MILAPYLFIGALTVQTQSQSLVMDSLRLLAMRLPESALVLEARARPHVVREALTEALARTVKAPQIERERELGAARRLAAAYAVVWSDSFLVREVARFASWSPQRRAAKVWVDSVRGAGISVFGRDGPMAAIVVWRRALTRATTNHDTAGIASVHGNVGAGFLENGSLDSAASHLERARALAVLIGDRRVEANAISLLASVSEDRGDLAVARERYAQALALRDRIGDSRGEAADRNNLGLLVQSAGDLDEARTQFEAALAINQRDRRDELAATNLVNLAGLASLAGDFARAESLYRNALATWKARGMWAHAADALHGLGQMELRRGDYIAGRSALVEALAHYERTEQFLDAVAVRRQLAAALAAMGELQGALLEYGRAQRAADSLRAPPGVRAGIVLGRADFAVQLNAFAEAERLYDEAELLFRRARDASGEAEAKHGRAILLLERDNSNAARPLLEAALRTQTAAGNQRGAALTRLSLSKVSLQRGDTAAARAQLARAAADLERAGDQVATAAALGERATLEAAARSPAAAESLYRSALQRVENRVAPEVAWQLHAGLALTLRTRGSTNDAARELRAALAELERPSKSLTLAERRSRFLADKWDVYAQLAHAEFARGRPGAAFEAGERLRAREMLELLSRGRITTSRANPELVVREQDLRQRIAELTRELEKAAAGTAAVRGPDVATAGAATRGALLRAQESYGELLLEMRERLPRHAELLSRETAGWTDVARRLSAEEAFIEYVVSDSGSLAFVIVRDTMTVLDLGVDRREVVQLVEFVRGALARGASSPGDSLWRGALRRLHQHLIAPVEESGLLARTTRLVLVPHAELHYLPFAALVDGTERGRVLVDRYEVTTTPSASVWLALGDRRARRTVDGVLALAPKTATLLASGREVAAIGRLGGENVSILTGSGATEDVFRREAPTRRVLHLATYGVLNKHNPLFSFVELAPSAAHDGRLEVHEVFGLDLAADLVVLSACQTGLGSGTLADVPAGDDWVGLTRAFLHAGAARVIATLWPVDDWATAALMERVYEGLVGGFDPARALAEAQRAMRRGSATSHPFYWAGFVVVGGADSR